MWSESLTIYDPVQEIAYRLDAESEEGMYIEELIGKKVKIIGEHPHSGEAGTVDGFDKTLAGLGIRIKLENGQGCYVYSYENLKLLSGK
jgi:hypothetical protein